MTNPYIFAFGITVILMVIIFICVIFNKKRIEKIAPDYVESDNQTSQKKEERQSTKDDVYHVGGITSEYFILLLMEHNTMYYAGYSYEVLQDKKTQTNFDAFALFDGLWDIFGVFDEILELDFVEDGYGTLYRDGVETTYDEKNDVMRIKTFSMMLSGTVRELAAFRDCPTDNYEMLDIRTASHYADDYFGVIEDK